MQGLGKYSFGIGDRFAQQGKAQLKAFEMARKAGIEMTPVWNKSNREHQIIHTNPEDTRHAADAAVKETGWKGGYFVDADHINLNNVDKFINVSDFFTIDVADYIGKAASAESISQFVKNCGKYTGELKIPGISETFHISQKLLEEIAGKFLFATQEASKIYQHIESKKGKGNFITEVSIDEVDVAQSPVELFFILLSLGKLGVPVQTIAPKFTGRFNKGVDYEGSVDQFRKEFEQDLLVIDYAVKEFGLPSDLKLSVHSGSDKFSIYPIMGRLVKKHDKGIHIKTAGTTWLEEVIGLSLGTPEALDLAKAIYTIAYRRKDELCGPYSTVIDIKASELPEPSAITPWTKEEFSETLIHNAQNPRYNASFRQLIHVGFKVASEYGPLFIEALEENRSVIESCVTGNLYERHIKRFFVLEE